MIGKRVKHVSVMFRAVDVRVPKVRTNDGYGA